MTADDGGLDAGMPTGQLGDVLVIEHDVLSAVLIQGILEPISRRLCVVAQGAAALDRLAESAFDLITLDIALPEGGGLGLLPQLRARTDAPVIMVAALGQSSAVVQALGLGADDYVVKPVQPADLQERALALARRTAIRAAAIPRYVDGCIAIDFEQSRVVSAAGTSSLSATERRLLRELVANAGRVLTHEELLRRVWGANYADAVANLHVFISYLRRKIDRDPRRPSYIRTHRGVGYEFVTGSAPEGLIERALSGPRGHQDATDALPSRFG